MNPQGFGASCSRCWPALWKSRKSRPQGFSTGFIWISTVFWKQITFDSSLVSTFRECCTPGKSFYLVCQGSLFPCCCVPLLSSSHPECREVGSKATVDCWPYCWLVFSTSALWSLKSVCLGAGSFCGKELPAERLHVDETNDHSTGSVGARGFWFFCLHINLPIQISF